MRHFSSVWRNCRQCARVCLSLHRFTGPCGGKEWDAETSGFGNCGADGSSSAKLILEGGEHPWALIDQVCSPGGTTIEGIAALQDAGFEAGVRKSVDAALEKDRSYKAAEEEKHCAVLFSM